LCSSDGSYVPASPSVKASKATATMALPATCVTGEHTVMSSTLSRPSTARHSSSLTWRHLPLPLAAEASVAAARHEEVTGRRKSKEASALGHQRKLWPSGSQECAERRASEETLAVANALAAAHQRTRRRRGSRGGAGRRGAEGAQAAVEPRMCRPRLLLHVCASVSSPPDADGIARWGEKSTGREPTKFGQSGALL
jgi:hypothetical protein